MVTVTLPCAEEAGGGYDRRGAAVWLGTGDARQVGMNTKIIKGDRVSMKTGRGHETRHARVTWVGTTKAKIAYFTRHAGILTAIVPQSELVRVDGRGHLVGAWNGPGSLS
jgi:hypothetical protein